jgi:hypothetical protein
MDSFFVFLYAAGMNLKTMLLMKAFMVTLLLSFAWSVGAAETNSLTPPKPAAEAKPPTATNTDDIQDLYNGLNLKGWKITPFAGPGEIKVVPLKKALESLPSKPDQAEERKKLGNPDTPVILIESGAMLTGLTYTNPTPKMDYEIQIEAMRVDGNDFFCGLTFPVNDACCSFIVGGWGGGLVGISSLDGMDASENETTKFMGFQSGQWYKIRVRVTRAKIEAWIDQQKMVDVKTEGRRISMRPGEIELSKPFGYATYQTTAAIRSFQLLPISK